MHNVVVVVVIDIIMVIVDEADGADGADGAPNLYNAVIAYNAKLTLYSLPHRPAIRIFRIHVKPWNVH